MNIPSLLPNLFMRAILLGMLIHGTGFGQGEANAAIPGSPQPNGGVITDRFTVFLIDEFVKCVNSAKADDTTATLDQRARVLNSLYAALDRMFLSESWGAKRSRAVGDRVIKRNDTMRSLRKIIDLYVFYAEASRTENIADTPASVLKEAIPHLKDLKRSVASFRDAVNQMYREGEGAGEDRNSEKHPSADPFTTPEKKPSPVPAKRQ